MIPYGKHFIDEDDIKSVVDVLRNGPLTQGPKVKEFENKISRYVGSKYAVAVASCTAGLHIALQCANLKRTDYLVTSPITFVSSANASFYVNSKIDFVDIERETINLSPKSLKETINKNKDIKAVMPVHFSGLPCKMDEISEIAKSSNLFVIEDAAHALGATYKDGSKVGNCKYSDATVFSFHPVKAISAGEGGMITTNNEEIYKRLLRLRSHGINKSNDGFINLSTEDINNKDNPWYYEMQELGYHFRISDIQCALALSQLKKLDKFIKRRKELVARYDTFFENNELIKPIQISGRKFSAHHLYVVEIDFQKLQMSRGSFMKNLKKRNIITQVHYIPVSNHPFYLEIGFNPNEYPLSQQYYKKALSLPLYYSLKNSEQDYVMEQITNLLK